MNGSMTYSGIIFDFNGTLFQDTPMHELVWREYSARLRGYPLSAEEFVQMHGRPNLYYLEYLLNRPVSDEEAEYYGEEKEKIYRQMCRDLGPDIHLTPGAEDLLDFLAAEGIPRTIATASSRPNVDFYFEVFHLDRWFEFDRVVYHDGSFPGKPDPEIYIRAAKKLRLPARECIVVEDAKSGIEAAYNAGIGCIQAIGPKEAHGVLKSYKGVAHTITDFTEFDRELLNVIHF
jgi:HAD superfamily hydrolase (TIGR01509 family)